LLSAAEEQDCFSDGLAGLGLGGALLDEGAEGGDTRSGADHDDGLGGVRGELEVGVADMDGDVDTVVLVAGAGDGVF